MTGKFEKFALSIILSLVVITVIRCEGSVQPPDEGKVPKPNEPSDKKNPLARGWGDNINWIDLEAGIEVAKEEKKPLMLLIHKTWCGACQTLKGKFAKAKMIAQLAKNFVMVNAEDDEEPWEEEYYPDGGKYIPRIIFLSPEGQVLKDIINPKDEYKQYPYYYSNPAPIITAMQTVLQKYGITIPGKEGKNGEVKKEEKDKAKKGDQGKKEKSGKDEDKKDLPRKGKALKEEEPEEPHSEPQPPSHKPPKKEL